MDCPSCGRQNPADARFCATCGSPLETACSKCGASLPEDARFCPACGHPVETAAAAEPGEERKLVTVLFADLVGSTPLGERVDAETFRDVTAEYFRTMRSVVEAEEGTVEKYIGDAIMAVFGAPAAHEDDPARALRAALRMLARLEELNRSLSERHGVELEMRIGVNTGEVIAVPEARPGEALVAGDAVNVAARLEQGAETGQILVGSRTARATRGFRFGPPLELELKGKGEAVTALPLLGEAERAAERGVPGLAAPLVGRDAELGVLHTIWTRVGSERRPHLVTVYGDAGVGKSRLTREFLDRASATDPVTRVLRGRCLPYGEGITYWPLAEVLKSVAGVLDTDTQDQALSRIRDAVAELLGPDRTAMSGALAYTVGLEDPSSGLRDLPPREVRKAVHDAWRGLFSALAEASHGVLLIEDLHWADAAMLDLLEDIAERIGGSLLILCTARPELTERRPGWGGGRRSFSSIALDPLQPGEADRLVRFLLDVADLPGTLQERILERAEGNPFFLEEIVRHLIDEGRIVRDQGRWRATEGLADVEIPDTVQGVLSARIDLLSPDQKRAVQRAAVVGRVFWAGPVARLLNGAADQVDDLLRALEDRELVASRVQSTIAGDQEFIFRHILTRDVAYDSLPRRERGSAHASVAFWLEDVVGERRREFSELLAHHYLEAHRLDGADGELGRKAFDYLLLAAEDARSKLALAAAKRMCESALELAASPEKAAEVHELWGRVEMEDYNGDASWYHFRTAADLRMEHAPEDTTGIARVCGLALELPLRWPGSMTVVPKEEEVRPYLEGGLAAAGDRDSPELARLLAARTFYPFGYPGSRWVRNDEALSAGERASGIAERLDLPQLLSAALDGLGAVSSQEGLYGTTVRVNERRMALVPRLHDPLEIGDTFAVAAWTWHHIGRYREAERLAAEGYRRMAGESPSTALHCLAWQGMARCRLGDWDGVLESARLAEGILGDRRDRPPGFALRLFGAVAFVQEIRGHAVDSDASLRAVFAVSEESRGDQVPVLYGAIGWVGLTLAHRGEFGEAHRWLDAQEAGPWQVHQGLIHEARTDIVADEGRWDAVPDLAKRLRAHAEQAGLEALPVFVDRMEGRAAIAGGDLERGVEMLAAARDGFGELDAAWDRALTALHRAEALAAASRDPNQDVDLDLAGETFERLGARRELERVERLR